MQAISLRQPAATLIVIGAQRVLTMSEPTDHTGALAIHASMKFPTAEKERTLSEPVRQALIEFGGEELLPKDLALMAIVGTVQLKRCGAIDDHKAARLEHEDPREFALGNYSLDRGQRWAWVLSNPVAFRRPIDCPGQQRLWEPPTEIRRQIAERTQEQLLGEAA